MADNFYIKIQKVLNDLIDRYRLVFWYDENGDMQELAHTLELPGVEVLTLDHNAFTTKHRILKGEQPERGFIVYCHGARPDDEDNWLLDLEQVGTLFSADMSSLYAAECNIPLELKNEVVDRHLEFFKSAGNRRCLTKRLRTDMDAGEMEKQMQAATCGTEPAYDYLTLALAEECYHGQTDMVEKMEKYNLLDLYWQEIEATFGYKSHHRIKDLLIVLFNDDLNRHIGSSILHNEAHIFMREWRDSRLHGGLYRQWAGKLEAELGISDRIEGYDIERLITVETFPCIDKVIATCLRNEVLNESMPVEKMESIVGEREHRIFFQEAGHTIKALLEARRLMEDIDQKMLKGYLVINSAEEGFNLYYRELYTIDLHYRHYFREADKAEDKEFLSEITKLVERRYTNDFLMELARRWQPIVDDMQQWKIDGVISQRHFYGYNVAPFITKGRKLFVIISDGLRYETMVEMEQRIRQMNRMVTAMKAPMLSTLPSYTQPGMAALLPHHQLSYDRHLDEVFADGISTMGTDNRQKVLRTKVKNSLAIIAENFLNITEPKTFFRDYDLIYIYSNKIDKRGHNRDTETEVFQATEEEFDHIIRIIEFIRNGNGSNVLITSDHGYLYQNEELDETDFTGFKAVGDVIADDRRFIIGNNLQSGSAVKTWNSGDVGLKEGRQIQIAKGLNRMPKKGSATRFVHGGSMLQEIVVPVLHVNITKTQDVSQVDVDILNRRAHLTGGSQTVCFYQCDAVTDKVRGVTLRAGFFDAENNLISDSVQMTFDSRSTDTTQREQRHRFIFKNQLSKLNGQEVTLRMERKIPDSEQFAIYKEAAYTVKVMFCTDYFAEAIKKSSKDH